MNIEEILDGVLSEFGEQVVVLDNSGSIVAANSGWREAHQNFDGAASTCGVGANYLEVCRNVSGEERAISLMAVEAIESVLSGKSQTRTMEYICDLPTGPALFIMTVKAFGGGERGALVTHRRSDADTAHDRDVLESSIAQLRRMVDVVPALLSYVDRDRRYRFVNQRYSDWFGHEPAEVVGNPIRDVIGEIAYEALLPDLERVFRGEEVHFERLLKYKDGGDRFVSGSLIPDMDENGVVQGYFALLIDSTEHHRSLEELRLSEERFSKLFNSIPLAMTISSLNDQKYVAVNDSYVRMTGINRVDVVGKSAFEVGVSMEEASVPGFLEALSENGFVQNFETNVFLPDGQMRTTLLSAVILDIGGEPFLAVSSNNITDRKKVEQDLRDLTTRLLNLQDKERRHLAQELHDTTAQKISALLLNLSFVRQSLVKADSSVAAAIDDAIAAAEQSLGEIRTLSYILHPPLLDQSGLRSAVRWFVDGFSRRSGINVEVAFAGKEKRLVPEIEGAMFRVLQESLSNVHRHSGSKRAFILLEHRPFELLLMVRDEGPPREKIHDDHVQIDSLNDIERLGVGISGMRERLRQFGGELEIKIAREGAKVTARIPLND